MFARVPPMYRPAMQLVTAERPASLKIDLKEFNFSDLKLLIEKVVSIAHISDVLWPIWLMAKTDSVARTELYYFRLFDLLDLFVINKN